MKKCEVISPKSWRWYVELLRTESRRSADLDLESVHYITSTAQCLKKLGEKNLCVEKQCYIHM